VAIICTYQSIPLPTSLLTPSTPVAMLLALLPPRQGSLGDAAAMTARKLMGGRGRERHIGVLWALEMCIRAGSERCVST
jgi:hypothetical protein